MISVITTDAEIDPSLLREIFARSLNQSFNRITVDGDTSTNDTVICLANGRSGAVIETGGDSERLFQNALDRVTGDLARMIAADGEGAGRFVEIRVRSAGDDDNARLAADAVANSVLFKCALHGQSPNWGRILAALGYSGAEFDPSQVDVFLEDRPIIREGLVVSDPDSEVKKALASDRLRFIIDLGRGEGEDVYYTCDMTPEYVEFNKD